LTLLEKGPAARELQVQPGRYHDRHLVNAKNFPRLAALTGRAMKIDAFAFTLTHP
jgi:hypothetical protein